MSTMSWKMNDTILSLLKLNIWIASPFPNVACIFIKIFVQTSFVDIVNWLVFKRYASVVSTVRLVFDDWLWVPFERIEHIGRFMMPIKSKMRRLRLINSRQHLQMFHGKYARRFYVCASWIEAYGHIILNVAIIIYRLANGNAYLWNDSTYFLRKHTTL